MVCPVAQAPTGADVVAPQPMLAMKFERLRGLPRDFGNQGVEWASEFGMAAAGGGL